MSLLIMFTIPPCTHCSRGEDKVYSNNITYNLRPMWEVAGIPFSKDINAKLVADIIGELERGVAMLKSDPDRFRAMNPPNGFGDYDSFLAEMVHCLAVAQKWPQATIYLGE